MSMKRKPFLVETSFRKYLLASIVTMMVLNLNGMVDAILMGQILGPDALAAVQACMTVSSLIACLNLLVTNGAALIVSEAIGKRDFETSNRSLSVSIVLNLIIGVTIGLLAGPLSRVLSSVVCVDKTILPNAEAYSRVLLLGSVVLMLQNGLSIIVDVSGSPRAVTVGMTASVAVNLLCDILFVKVMKTGISGAAAATLAGAAFSVVFFTVCFARKRKELHFRFSLTSVGRTLLATIQRGLSGIAGSVGIMLMTFLCNYFAQKAYGKDGLFVMSVGYSMISLGGMIANGIGMAFMGIGGSLAGQHDYTGFHILFKKGMLLSMIIGVAANVLSLFFPRQLAGLFGADREILFTMASEALPVICTFVIALSFISPLFVVYQVNGRFLLATVCSLAPLFFMAVAGLALDLLFNPPLFWPTFPIAAALSVLMTLLLSWIARRRSKEPVRSVSLIPMDPPDCEKFDATVECTGEGISSGLPEIVDFLRRHEEPRRADAIIHCVEELVINIVAYAYPGKKQYFDILIRREPEGTRIIIKDYGPPFDPVHCDEERWKSGLKILHHYSMKLDYSYAFYQNTTFMTFLPPGENGERENG